MAKIYGLFGSMTGKLADVVMVVRNGEQVARKYQPIVANPSTQAQVEARAKLKLMSQLSAIVGEVIAFRKEGSVSARNMFVKKNYQNATYASSKAQFDLTKTDLTGGLTYCYISNAVNDGTNITATISVANDVDTIEVAIFGNAGGDLRLLTTQQLTPTAGSASLTTALDYSAPVYIMAYGVRMNNDAAKTKYADILTPSDDIKALLDVVRTLNANDVTLTMTAVAHIASVTP